MRGGWGGKKTVRAGLVLSRLTPRLPDAARVSGREEPGMLLRSGRGGFRQSPAGRSLRREAASRGGGAAAAPGSGPRAVGPRARSCPAAARPPSIS